MRGIDRIVAPVRAPREYRAALPMVHDTGAFLSDFVANIRMYPVHVQGHPPGTVLVLSALRDLGLTSAWWPAALFIVGGAAAVPAVLVAARELAGERVARQAMPFVVLAPAAVWVATSADALYAGLAAWGAALVIVATGRRDVLADGAALAGGLLLAASLFASYGMVLLTAVPFVVAVRRRRIRPIAIAALVSAGVFVVFALLGFSWLDGLVATRDRYLAGIASRRPYVPFLFVNLAALAVAIGPTTVVALTRLRDRRMWTLVGAAAGAVGLAAISGMSKGEVERIWLPFVPWLLLAGVALVPSTTTIVARAGRRRAAGWLSVSVATAVALESAVRTPW
jgi:hypothetical protein